MQTRPTPHLSCANSRPDRSHIASAEQRAGDVAMCRAAHCNSYRWISRGTLTFDGARSPRSTRRIAMCRAAHSFGGKKLQAGDTTWYTVEHRRPARPTIHPFAVGAASPQPKPVPVHGPAPHSNPAPLVG